MSAPLLNGAYPQLGIGFRIHRYLVVETYEGLINHNTTDELVLVDWIAVGVIERGAAGGKYQVNCYVPVNVNQLPKKYQSALGGKLWAVESLHTIPSEAWSSRMRHWEHEVGSTDILLKHYRDNLAGAARLGLPEDRHIALVKIAEERLADHQRHADYCRAQWIAAVHAEDSEPRDEP